MSNLSESNQPITDIEFDQSGKLFISSQDQVLRVYSLSITTGSYVLSSTLDLSALGIPSFFTSWLITGMVHIAINNSVYAYTFS